MLSKNLRKKKKEGLSDKTKLDLDKTFEVESAGSSKDMTTMTFARVARETRTLSSS
jgi:hypothetical protein